MKARLRAIQDPKGKSRGRLGVAIDLPAKQLTPVTPRHVRGFCMPVEAGRQRLLC